MTYAEAMTQLTRLRSLMSGGDDSVFSSDDKALIEDLYWSELRKKVRTCHCRDRYTDAVIELSLTLKSKKAMAKEQKYQLRPGVIIWVGNDVYSSANLTDKVAAAYLKKHPEDRKKFEKLPEDYVSPAEAELLNN